MPGSHLFVMGITYSTTAAVQGDTFPVLIRKMAQKLGVSVDIGDNVYRVMWNILADLNWTMGTTQSFVNVANQNVTYITVPRQGDSLNVLFLKFAQRTGFVISVSSHMSAMQVVSIILDPETPVNGGGTTFTITYTNPFGTIAGSSTQVLADGATGTPVEAVTNLSLTFDSWSDGNTSNPRTDTVAGADLTVSADNWTEVPYLLGTEETFETYAVGEAADSQDSGVGWWERWNFLPPLRIEIATDDFESLTVGTDLSGTAEGMTWDGPWVVVPALVLDLATETFESLTVGDSLSGQTSGDGWDAGWTLY